jgi:hypothetical protein
MLLPRSTIALATTLFTPFVLGSALPWDASTPVTNSALAPVNNAAVVANTYIVQLKSLQHGLKDPSKRSIDAHELFHEHAKRQSLTYTTGQVYDQPKIFLGLSLTLTSDDDLQALKDLDNVQGVWPVSMVPRPAAALDLGHLSKRIVEARATYPDTNITIPYITGDLDVNSPHSMARVDDVHATGVKGKGIKIGIVDTGVDYRHPSLGGCFGPGCKVAYGYDVVVSFPLILKAPCFIRRWELRVEPGAHARFSLPRQLFGS